MKPLIVTDSLPLACWPAGIEACMHTMPPSAG